MAIRMHLLPVPTRVGDHDSGDALDDGMVVRRHVDAEQSVMADDGVVFIDPVVCATVTNVVLCTGSNVPPAGNQIVVRCFFFSFL